MLKEGFYEDAIFRFTINFTENFPKQLPSIVFKNEINHPLISPSGQLDLQYLFPNWRYEIGKQLLDILTKMRSIFNDKHYFEISDSLNPKAATLFKNEPETFLQQSIEQAKKSKKDFNNLPSDCPYRFNKVTKLPDEVKTVLENNQVS